MLAAVTLDFRSKTQIAFNRTGAPDLYVINEDGTGETLIAAGASAGGLRPAWSPDHSKIATETSAGLSVMNADGSGLVSFGIAGSEPAWNATGSRLAFTEIYNGDKGIGIVNADGSGLTHVLINQGLSWVVSNALWSPQPTWSTNGTQIAFVDFTFKSPGPPTSFAYNLDIYTANSDGSGKTNLTHFNVPNRHAHDPSWSPDGTRIVFTVEDAGNNIYAMNANGTGLAQLTTDGQSSDPTWSADGSRIAFSNGAAIAVMNADGSNKTTVTTNGYYPTW